MYYELFGIIVVRTNLLLLDLLRTGRMAQFAWCKFGATSFLRGDEFGLGMVLNRITHHYRTGVGDHYSESMGGMRTFGS